jgi:hypothetical protein
MMSEVDEHGYPFLEEWLARKAEPLPDGGIDWNQRSPLAKERLPEREEKTLFDGKEKVAG